MLSRVAAVKAPRTHNRRRVTGSRGRRREGRESEPKRPNMSRHLFNFVILLLLVTTMCCATCRATPAKENDGNSDLRGVQELQWVDLFVPQTTQVLPKKGTGSSGRDSFVSPSLVSAGGVIAAFAEGRMMAEYGTNDVPIKHFSSEVVAEYIDSAWEWPTLVEKVKKDTWKPQTVLGKAGGKESLDVVRHPTTTMKDNRVFLLVGSTALSPVNGSWKEGSLELKLVVGEVTKPSADSEPSEWIKWGEVQSPVQRTTLAAQGRKLTEFIASGGSGVLMEDGTIVFSLMAMNEKNDGVYSMIIYSKDNGSTWSLSNSVSPAKCGSPRITEWEGSLLMIVDCENGQRVYESRDMGTAWTEATGILPGVWAKPQPEDSKNLSLHVEALITAIIAERKVMLYIQRGYASVEKRERALYLWVTDNNRSFYFGPVGIDTAVRWEFTSSLLYSGGNLHLLQRRDNDKGGVISLSRLTEELKEIESVLSTWSQKDVFFSNLSIPTAGLVAVLSNASVSDGTWNDEYLCLNATVTNATKVEDGFQLTEPDSGVMWPANTRGDNVRHVFLSHNLTLVASVTIEVAPSNNTPLLGATLGDANSPLTMGILYTADKKWVTMFNDKTTESGTWESGKEYQVALMLQGNKASVYIDGQSLGEEETLLTAERPLELAVFCFGACEIHNSPVTVKNVFLYNRPLNSTEMTAIKDRKPVWTRAPEPQAGDVPQTIASAVSGPEKNSAAPAVPMTLNPHAVKEVSEGGAAKKNTSWTEGVQFVVQEVSLNSAGSGLLPSLLLLLLGLWGFAAA
ncbi:trans-sialidase, putative [Trypanosoma cruzi]|uniref:Trans-sialidase, putative n=1 Tax=Trypanosoma cruzi (strain CL Brener) TaxID=353153 RepID=Q4CPT6_TRYCC|nr:trans-sialidase, putative [Trypanosoma cruzi]EAN82288.1 trans-sialidase, putative [Trypanosoma cruzi]|eukprot:XP_804139.1 trans-sialidase [Trypanosoma cruzi strain CL Brener]